MNASTTTFARRRATRLLALVGVLAGAGLGLAACGGSSVPGNAVAMVGTTPITKSDFAHWMTIAAHSTTPAGETVRAPVPDPPEYSHCIAYLRSAEHTQAPVARSTTAKLKNQCAESYKADKRATMNFLVSAQWIIGEAQELGVTVSNKEVEDEYLKVKKQDYRSETEFHKFLADTGYTVPDLMLKTKVEQILPPKIEKAIIARAEKAVTKAVVEKYYTDHKKTYHRTEGAGLYILLVNTKAKAEAAKAEIESGHSFASVAKRVSILHTSQQGGVYLTAEAGREEKGLNEAIFAAKTNVLTGPVKTPSGYYLLEVKSHTPEHEETLAQAEPQIRGTLVPKKIEAELSGMAARHERKWRAKTDCNPGYVISLCKQSKA